MHFAARLFSGELPPDGDTVTICASIPGFGLAAQRGDVPGPSPSQTLAAEKADLNLSLVQPTSVCGSVVHGEAFPEQSARFFPESVHKCLAGVGAQVVQNQMDGIGGGVLLGDL